MSRGLDVTYTGPGQMPIQPHETEFHIHPCFRPSLNAERPAPLTSFQDSVPVAYGAPVQSGSIGVHNVVFGSDNPVTPSRNFRLLDELTRSCQRILRLLSRADLPSDAREQVSAEISQLLSSTLRAGDGDAVDAVRHVTTAADYLAGLARQLEKAGIDDSGSVSVVRMLRGEAQELLAELGGNTRRRL